MPEPVRNVLLPMTAKPIHRMASAVPNWPCEKKRNVAGESAQPCSSLSARSATLAGVSPFGGSRRATRSSLPSFPGSRWCCDPHSRHSPIPPGPVHFRVRPQVPPDHRCIAPVAADCSGPARTARSAQERREQGAPVSPRAPSERYRWIRCADPRSTTPSPRGG